MNIYRDAQVSKHKTKQTRARPVNEMYSGPLKAQDTHTNARTRNATRDKASLCLEPVCCLVDPSVIRKTETTCKHLPLTTDSLMLMQLVFPTVRPSMFISVKNETKKNQIRSDMIRHDQI